MAFDPDKYLATQSAPPPSGFDPDAYLASKEGIPISRASSPLTQLGRSAASLGDVAWGMTLPAAVEYVAQPVARMFTSPERSAEIAQTIGGAVSQPFGKAFGVTETPEYKGEITRRVGGLVGEAVGEKVKAIAEKTGLPEQDVEIGRAHV